MADDLDDGEFWLPSQFLTDDDILMEKKTLNKGLLKTESKPGFCFPSEFPYGGFSSFGKGSALGSPVESVVSSTETESDEEDYLAGLTRQMARSMLQQAENVAPVFGSENPKTRVMSGSPQSPLCGVGSWSGCSAGSSRGSPNGPSQVSSPPTTPLNGKDDAWDVLYAAAGQMVRMNMNDDGVKYGRGLLGPPRKPSPVTAPLKNTTGFYSNQAPALTQQQIQVNHFHQLKQQQQQQQQQRCSSAWGRQGQGQGQAKLAPSPTPPPVAVQPQQARSAGFTNNRCGRPLGLPVSAWPPLQQPQNGSGMRAVFLGGSGTRRESSGTGVFLPRRTGTPTDTRKKPACATVLLPARVVQALNLNFEEIGGAAQPRFVPQVNGNAILSSSHQRRNNSYRAHHSPVMNTTEVQLPQEWTY